MYLLTIWGMVEPEILGPFATDNERLAAAKAFLDENGGDGENAVFRIDMDGGVPLVSPFINYEIEEE